MKYKTKQEQKCEKVKYRNKKHIKSQFVIVRKISAEYLAHRLAGQVEVEKVANSIERTFQSNQRRVLTVIGSSERQSKHRVAPKGPRTNVQVNRFQNGRAIDSSLQSVGNKHSLCHISARLESFESNQLTSIAVAW